MALADAPRLEWNTKKRRFFDHHVTSLYRVDWDFGQNIS